MLRKIVMGSLLIVTVGALVVGVTNLLHRPANAAPVEVRTRPGRIVDRESGGATATNLPSAEPGTLDEAEVNAMIEALNDEYKALATYRKVVDKFGDVRPFTSIMKAEEQHIAALETLFVRYGLEIPENDWYDRMPEFSSVTEACQAGVQAEIDNAALYNRLFAAVDEPDIIQVFTRLRDASQNNHLPAFERCTR